VSDGLGLDGILERIVTAAASPVTSVGNIILENFLYSSIAEEK